MRKKKTRRDLGSRRLLELRRLGMKAPRSIDNRKILTDALLQTYPYFAKLIDRAHNIAEWRIRTGRAISEKDAEEIVLFFPDKLGHYVKETRGWPPVTTKGIRRRPQSSLSSEKLFAHHQSPVER